VSARADAHKLNTSEQHTLVPACLPSVTNQCGVRELTYLLTQSLMSAPVGLGAMDSEDDDDGSQGRERQLSVRTGVLDEKCAALNALGHYAEHLPAQFAPYLVQALQLAAAGANYFHENIRAQVSGVCEALCCFVYMMMPMVASIT